jgi:predicted aldo/keto reductase-like oxidoreductase
MRFTTALATAVWWCFRRRNVIMEMEMKKLGFGTMRLPVLNQEDPAAVDLEQLQLNYIDWDSPNIQSRQCCEVCRRYGKDVIVMEPVKGGTLADVPR